MDMPAAILPTPAQRAPHELPLDSISVQPGFNPRRAFRAEPLTRLVDSIRNEGLACPITVRPRDDGTDGYWLIAGERRLRAFRELGKATIPVLVRECDEAAAKRIALVENLDRADLSPAEEAIAARDWVNQCAGDQHAAASQLGWPVEKVRARLLLLTCSDAVLQAVAEGAILTGHAELLAGLPVDQQDKALPKIIEHRVTVADLREQVRGVVIPLKTAIFDLSACNGCEFNTATQSSLFSEGIREASCKNRACFMAKTRAALESKRKALADEVNTVAFATEKAPGEYTPLIREGRGGVGATQYTACKGCKHFGALIHDKLDGRAGVIERPVCFDLACHREKVAAYAASLTPPPEATTETPQAQASSRAQTPRPPAPVKCGVGPKCATPGSSFVGAAGRAIARRAYEQAAIEQIAASEKGRLAFGLYAMHKLYERDAANPSPLAGVLGKQTEVLADPVTALPALLALDAETISRAYRDCVAWLLTGTPKTRFSLVPYNAASTACAVARATGAPFAKYFKVDATYLESLTIAAIEGLMEEAGVKKWLLSQEDGETKWKALLKHKKSELPEAVMALGFDWTGFVPKAIEALAPPAFGAAADSA